MKTLHSPFHSLRKYAQSVDEKGTYPQMDADLQMFKIQIANVEKDSFNNRKATLHFYRFYRTYLHFHWEQGHLLFASA